MASGIIYGTTSNQTLESKIEWRSVPDEVTNSSEVMALLYYRRNNTYTGTPTSGTGTFSITIDGQTSSEKKGFTIPNDKSWVLAISVTKIVEHEDDGSKTITISAAGSLPPSSLTSTNCSDEVTLDSIARKSEFTVSKSSITMLQSVTINIDRKSEKFVHDLTYSINGDKGSIANDVENSYEWTVPDLVSQIPDSLSGTCTITCATRIKGESTVIGTDSTTLVVTVPDGSKPILSADSVVMPGELTISVESNSKSFSHDISYVIEGYNEVTLQTDIGSSYKWDIPDLTSLIPNKTNVECTVTLTTRNGTATVGSKTVELTLHVPEKSKPTLSALSVVMLNKVTITANRQSNSFTHDLTYKINGFEGVIATGVNELYEWTVPDLVSKISGKTSDTCTIYCKTKNGTAEVGIESVTLTVSVPEKTSIRLSADTVKMPGRVTVFMDSLSDGFTHDLSYTVNGKSGNIVSSVKGSYEWRIPDLSAVISGKTNDVCTVYCKTMNGTAEVGTTAINLTLNVPDASSFSASSLTVKMGNNVVFTITPNSDHFRHKLSYVIGGKSEVIATDVIKKGEWTPSKELAAYTNNKLSAICEIICETYTGSALVGKKTIDITLTVPDATIPILSASTVEMGGKLTITLDKKTDAYTHNLSYALKNVGGSTVIYNGTIGEVIGGNYEWEVPLSLAAEMPNAIKGTITITCQTLFKNSTSVVGEKAVSFTVTVPNNDDTRLTFTMSVEPVSELPDVFNGIYVQGKSQVKVSYAAKSDYSDISTYKTVVLGRSGYGNPHTSQVLTTNGKVSVAGTVTDTRGYSVEKSTEIVVIPYSKPRIIPGEGQTKIICERCNSDGGLDPGGTYLKIEIGRMYSGVVSNGIQKNYCKLSYQYKTDAAGEGDYSKAVELLPKDATDDYVSIVVPGVSLNTQTAYDVRLIAEDDIGEKDTVTVVIRTMFATWHAPIGGHGFTLGGYHDPSKYNVFDCRFDAEFQGCVSGSVLGLLGSSGSIPANGDANDYKTPGVFAVSSYANAKTIKNIPLQTAGLLRVYAAIGQDYVTSGNWKYIMQEFRSVEAGAPEYRRYISSDGEGKWSYGEWKPGIDTLLHFEGNAVKANVYADEANDICRLTISTANNTYKIWFKPDGIAYVKNDTVIWNK